MEKTVVLEISADEAEQLEVEIKELLSQIRDSQERMKVRQDSMERTKAETRKILDDIERLLAAR